MKHHSDDKFQVHKDLPTPIQAKLQAEKVVNDAKVVQTLNRHNGSTIVDICQCSNTLLATACDKGEIILWKLPLYSVVCEFKHGTECTSIAFCTDETKQRFLLSA